MGVKLRHLGTVGMKLLKLSGLNSAGSLCYGLSYILINSIRFFTTTKPSLDMWKLLTNVYTNAFESIISCETHLARSSRKPIVQKMSL
jgi:hypothetical protein